MPWILKTFPEIYQDMQAVVLSKFPGAFLADSSLVALMLKAAALQDAEQYVQMARILDAFDIDTAEGDDLDRKALDFNLTRIEATQSVGYIRVGDSDFTTKIDGSLSVAVPLGGTILNLQAGEGAAFGATTPFNVILDRDGANRETVTVVNVSGDQFQISPGTLNAHAIGVTVIKATVGSDRTITLGEQVKVPDTSQAEGPVFDTTAVGTLLDGDIETADIPIQSIAVGAATVVGGGRISEFLVRPFTTATVRNPEATSGGLDRESDEDFRARIKRYIQELSRGTAVAIISRVTGVEKDGRTVVNAQITEPVGPGVSRLWIDDGTGTLTFAQTTKSEGEVLLLNADGGELRARMDNWPVIRGTAKLFASEENGTATAVGLGTLDDTAKAWIPAQWSGGNYVMVDENQNFYTIGNNTATQLNGLTALFGAPTTPNLGYYCIFDQTATLVLYDASFLASFPAAVTDDVIFSYANGQLELNTSNPTWASGLAAGQSLVAFNGYDYATGLVQEVARVVEGDADDLITYPGVKATGTYVDILLPTVVNFTFVLSIRALDTFDETELRPLVQDAVIRYVNALSIGEDVILSEIIRRAKSVDGVYDVNIISPASNQIVAPGQLPNTDTSLVTVF